MSKLSKKNRDAVIEILHKEYEGSKCALDYKTNFELLVAVVLSAQTTDVAVNKISPALFKEAPDAFSMSKLSTAKLEKLIKSIGLYKNKAKNISALSKELCAKFNGEVPDNFDDLVSLPGVGRKTANVVLAELFNQQTIAVDTHVQRLSNRIGLTESKTPLETELQLQKAIPFDWWTQMHHALIWHGRKVCSAKSPCCDTCCINTLCKKNGL